MKPFVDGGFDPVIHAPARLQIAALLAAVHEAEFALVRETTGVSDSVLSKHVRQMEAAAYVSVRKAAAGGRTRTWLALTRKGRRAFASHMAALEAMARLARQAAE